MAKKFTIAAIFEARDRITAPVTRMQNRIGKMTRSVGGFFNRINRMNRGVARSFSKLSYSISRSASAVSSFGRGIKSVLGTSLKFATGGIIALGGAVAYFTSKFAVLENAEAAFTPLLGGLKKANEMVKALNIDAEKTPFRFETLADVTKQLLPVMNKDIEKTRKTYKMLGDTAGGNAEKLTSITRGYTKALLKGKVDLEALNMIGEAGVPIFEQLAKSMGKNVDAKFFKSISAGKITVKDLENAFVKMTSKGGLFFKGMEIASQTTTGKWSTFLDAVDSTSEVIGKVLNKSVKVFIDRATRAAKAIKAWVEANEAFLQQRVDYYFKVMRDGIASFIEWIQRLNKEKPIFDRIKSAITNISDAISYLKNNAEKLTSWITTVGYIAAGFLAFATAIKVVTVAMGIFNVVVALNPISLMVIGIVALIAGFTALVVWIDDVIAGFNKMPWYVQAALLQFKLLFNAIKLVKDGLSYIFGFGDKAIKIPKIITEPNIQGLNVANDILGNRSANQNFTPRIVSQAERSASLQSKHTNQTEITIKDETGRASVTKGKKNNGLRLQSTGGF